MLMVGNWPPFLTTMPPFGDLLKIKMYISNVRDSNISQAYYRNAGTSLSSL